MFHVRFGESTTMTVTLETLEMTAEELACCRDAVQKSAYLRWLDAGCPESGGLEFWLQAEREWIEKCYVPHRLLDGTRPGSTLTALMDAAEVERSDKSRAKPRRRAPASAK